MSQQSSEPAGPAGDDWPDDLWPDDDEGAPGDQWRPPGTAPGWPGGPPRRRPSAATLAVVALVAVAAGAGIALGVQTFSGSPAAPAASGAQTPGLGPGQGGQPGGGGQPFGGGQPGQGGQAGPGGGFPGGSGQTGQAFIIGKVIKVGATSITLGGPGRTITAGITSSTRITGKVSGISGIKVGDEVSAQITENNGTATATAIQYPAQFPSGGVPGG